MARVIKKDYFKALCELAFDLKETGYVRSTALVQLFKVNAKNELTVINHQDLVEQTKNLPVSTIKDMVDLAYQALLKKIGRDDSRTMSLFKAALNRLSEHELRLEWEAIADGTVSSIVETMLNWDQQSDRTKKDIVQIFEGLAVPYFRDYKGNVPKEDLEFAHKLVKDYFKSLKDSELLLKEEKKSLPAAKKSLKATAQIDTFKVYDYTQPANMKSKELKCKEEDLEQCLRKLIGVSKMYESKLEQPKKGSWVFKAKGKEYTVTKYTGE